MSPFPAGMSQFIFTAMRRSVGSPIASLVLPVTQWDIAGQGVSYEISHDIFRDGNGDAVDPADIWTTRTLDILPSTRTRETQALVAVGELPEDSSDIYIYGQADIAAVKACYGIILGSKLYRVAEVVPTPNDSPQWALVRLFTL